MKLGFVHVTFKEKGRAMNGLDVTLRMFDYIYQQHDRNIIGIKHFIRFCSFHSQFTISISIVMNGMAGKAKAMTKMHYFSIIHSSNGHCGAFDVCHERKRIIVLISLLRPPPSIHIR